MYTFWQCLDNAYSSILEPHAGEFEVVWLNLQQQMVHRHIYNPVPQQKRSVWGEDQEVSTHNMFPRVHRYVHSCWITIYGSPKCVFPMSIYGSSKCVFPMTTHSSPKCVFLMTIYSSSKCVFPLTTYSSSKCVFPLTTYSSSKCVFLN